MKRITKYGIAGIATAGLLVAGAGSAFAGTGPSDSGQVTGVVSVANALTLNLINTSFTVNNAQPGVSFNGVPPIGVTILTNDPGGYALAAYMDDNNSPTYHPGGLDNGCQSDAFWNGPINTDTGASIPDSSWTDTSTGTFASGGSQAFPEQSLRGAGTFCNVGGPDAITVGGENTGPSASGGDSYTEQLAVTVPANANGTYNGALTFLATGA
jgi:hypothetical protein